VEWDKSYWRKLHNAELNDLYFSHNMFLAKNSRRISWVCHVPRIGDRWVIYSYFVWKTLWKIPHGSTRHRGKWYKDASSVSRMKVYRLVRDGSGWGQNAVNSGCGNESLGSLKCREFLDYLKTFLHSKSWHVQ